MIITAFDYSQSMRIDSFGLKKFITSSFIVDFMTPDVSHSDSSDNMEPSGYFYICKNIKTLFLLFQYNKRIFLAQKNKDLCLIHDLSDKLIHVELKKKILTESKTLIISSNNEVFKINYKVNFCDKLLFDANSYEEPDFFIWLCEGLEGYLKDGISFPNVEQI